MSVFIKAHVTYEALCDCRCCRHCKQGAAQSYMTKINKCGALLVVFINFFRFFVLSFGYSYICFARLSDWLERSVVLHQLMADAISAFSLDAASDLDL